MIDLIPQPQEHGGLIFISPFCFLHTSLSPPAGPVGTPGDWCQQTAVAGKKNIVFEHLNTHKNDLCKS